MGSAQRLAIERDPDAGIYETSLMCKPSAARLHERLQNQQQQPFENKTIDMSINFASPRLQKTIRSTNMSKC